jgi:addiction module HigA family antidote
MGNKFIYQFNCRLISTASLPISPQMETNSLKLLTIIKEHVVRTVPYPKPGEILLEEFLKPMNITQYRLAKDIGVPQRRIGEIIAGKRGITADTGLRLSRYFGTSEGFWTGLQDDYDRAITKDRLQEVLSHIQPCLNR